MKMHFLFLLSAIVFLSGCIYQTETQKVSNVGLSTALTISTKQVKASSPVTFILNIKNLASEVAEGIKVQLLNLNEWRIENELQELKELLPNDIYKFSWIAYAPQQSKNFTPTANIFYFMKTKSDIKLRVYNNDYLNTLSHEERNKIKEKSAILFSTISKNTPVLIEIHLQQPFILTQKTEKFPFVLEIKNVGLGEVYKNNSKYPPTERDKDYVTFSYSSNSTLECDSSNGEIVKLANGAKSIVCRVVASQIDKYSDFSINFTVSYAYLDKTKTEIKVV
ncbi:MAG: hypothetical protein QW423_01175 [Candidatus Aenigmatarchaeota archaeon]